jgi:hypothetical protein
MVAALEVRGMGDRQRGDKPDPRDGLTPKQRQVMWMLARETPLADAARMAGVNEERVKRWTKTRAFRDALAKERSDPSRSSIRDASELFRSRREPKPEIPRSPSARHSKALDLLASGSSVTEAAEGSGYSRQHLSHLVHQDPEFRSEYERRLAEEHIRRANFFWTIWGQSADVVKQSLAEGDPQAAMDVFRLGARGVTDIERRYADPDQPELVGKEGQPLSLPAQSPPDVSVLASESAGLTCDECGLEAKSRRGLTQHRNPRHRSLEKPQEEASRDRRNLTT